MTRLYIGGLPADASRRELEREFEYFGQLRDVWVARNPPGFGFIVYEDGRDADDAVREMDGKRVCGSRIRVEFARGPTRGGRGGRYGSREKCYECGKFGHSERVCTRRRSYRERDRERDGRRRRSRSRSRSRGRRSYSRSRSRSRSKSRKSREKKRSSSRSQSRSKERSHSRSRSQEKRSRSRSYTHEQEKDNEEPEIKVEEEEEEPDNTNDSRNDSKEDAMEDHDSRDVPEQQENGDDGDDE